MAADPHRLCMSVEEYLTLDRNSLEARYVYPDIPVSCGPRDQEQGDSDIMYCPCVVIEVLSSSTEAYDRGRKFDFYRACQMLQEYVLVDTQQRVGADGWRTPPIDRPSVGVPNIQIIVLHTKSQRKSES